MEDSGTVDVQSRRRPDGSVPRADAVWAHLWPAEDGARLWFPFHEGGNEAVREVGGRWQPARRHWLVPTLEADTVTASLEALGFVVIVHDGPRVGVS